VSGGISAVFGGVIVGTVGVIASVSFAALIFSGPLLPHLEAGIGIALLSGVVAGLASAVLGSHPVVISGPQGAPATILAIIAAAVVARLEQ
jgi:SulP family sulfate permease